MKREGEAVCPGDAASFLFKNKRIEPKTKVFSLRLLFYSWYPVFRSQINCSRTDTSVCLHTGRWM